MRLGIRGIRFNLVQAGATTVEMLEPLSRRVNEFGWHVQIHMLGDKIVEIEPLLQRLPSPVIFDHLGRIPQPAGIDHPAFAVISRLIDKGRAWVKLSGAYIDTKLGPPAYADTTKVAQAYVKAAPERLVWGSDWPHPTEKKSRTMPCSSICSVSGPRAERRAGRSWSTIPRRFTASRSRLRSLSREDRTITAAPAKAGAQ